MCACSSTSSALAPEYQNRTRFCADFGEQVSGNLAGIEQHLDYLKALGVTGLWTTPVVSNGDTPESYHGYAATNLYKIDPHFGTLADYEKLSKTLHARGMKLVFDMVPNHISVLHPWVLDPPEPHWLHGTPAHHLSVEHDFYGLVDPHAPERAWKDVTHGWFTNSMPDLNQENPEVAQYLIENALWWVETAHLDGIRLDTFPYVGRAFWQQFHAALHQAYPHLTTVGEIFNRDPEVTSFFAGGVAHRGIDTGLDTPFDFPVFFTLRDVLAHDKPMTELAGVLRQDALYPHPARLATFIGNHDTTRFFTDSGESVARQKLALGLVLTLRGMPVIYSGDEIAMPGGADPDNRHDFPGGFAGDAHNAFIAAGRTGTQQEVFQWTAGLIAFRQAHAELTHGAQQDLEADANTFAFVRAEGFAGCNAAHTAERLLIVVNKGATPAEIGLPVDETALSGCTEFKTSPVAAGGTAKLRDGVLQVQEPAESLTVITVR
ncbi:MAG TPA: alpha-amylase family glycosyl hydrolase [Terracidiphilus sp.]|nr:alpha-amylase family glycosyl hydrolase [Terracidiphilus sp.]